MPYTDALTALVTLGPLSFLAGVVVGYRFRDLIGRTHHDHR